MTTSPTPLNAKLPDWLNEPTGNGSPAGVKLLVLGESGSGKTFLMHTLVEAGLEVFHIGLEPARQTVAKAIHAAIPTSKADYTKYHYIDLPALVTDFKTMVDTSTKLNTLSFKTICDLEGLNRDKTRQFIKLLELLANVKLNDVSYGAVDSWDSSRVLVIDSLSALNIMAKSLIVGSNPAMSPSQWNMAQDTIRNLLNKLCFSCNCHVIVLGHLEPEKDEVSGKIVNMPSTLGKKLAPELGRYFDEVIVVKKQGDKHQISTKESNTSTKVRLFPTSDALPPTLVPLIAEWRKVNNLTTGV